MKYVKQVSMVLTLIAPLYAKGAGQCDFDLRSYIEKFKNDKPLKKSIDNYIIPDCAKTYDRSKKGPKSETIFYTVPGLDFYDEIIWAGIVARVNFMTCSGKERVKKTYGAKGVEKVETLPPCRKLSGVGNYRVTAFTSRRNKEGKVHKVSFQEF